MSGGFCPDTIVKAKNINSYHASQKIMFKIYQKVLRTKGKSMHSFFSRFALLMSILIRGHSMVFQS